MGFRKRPHTAIYFRHRVLVILKSGVRYIGRFLERKQRYVVIEIEADESYSIKIQIRDIRAFSPLRQDTAYQQREGR